MEEAASRRGKESSPDLPSTGNHERALRVIGHWIDSQKPHDVFLFEQDGAYVVRLHVAGQATAHHIARRVHPGRHPGPRRPGPDAAHARQARIAGRVAGADPGWGTHVRVTAGPLRATESGVTGRPARGTIPL